MVTLARRLNSFDFVLITMGSIIGSGIFRVPSVVAQHAHAPRIIVLVWAAGGVVALFGVFIFAELSARRPIDGGLYAYLRDAYSPGAAFLFGWMYLFVALSGGMAAAAVTFGGYFEPLAGLSIDPRIIAVVALVLLTAINCLGVRQGGNVQNAFMIAKLAAIAVLVALGFLAHPANAANAHYRSFDSTLDALHGAGLAMILVLFTYSGWQAATFVTGEVRDPSRTLPLGMLWGMVGTVVAYLLVNMVCLRALGTNGLMHTNAPASDVFAIGPIGERGVALLVSLSTLGFLSNRMLTAPRLYHAMAQDGLFLKGVAWVHPRTRAPVAAIILQGTVATIIAMFFDYEHILLYATWVSFFFSGMAAIALFIFRAQDARSRLETTVHFKVPGHPVSTTLFILASFGIVAETFATDPSDSAVGLGIAFAAIPAYMLWIRWSRLRGPQTL